MKKRHQQYSNDFAVKNKEIFDYKKAEKYATLHESMSAKQGIDVYFSEAVQSYPLW